MKTLPLFLLLTLGSSIPSCFGFSVGHRPLVSLETTRSARLHATVFPKEAKPQTSSSPDENHRKLLVWEALENALDHTQWEAVKELVSTKGKKSSLTEEEVAVIKFIVAAREQAKASKDTKHGNNDSRGHRHAVVYVWDALENEMSQGQWDVIKEIVKSQKDLEGLLNEEELAIIQEVTAARERAMAAKV